MILERYKKKENFKMFCVKLIDKKEKAFSISLRQIF